MGTKLASPGVRELREEWMRKKGTMVPPNFPEKNIRDMLKKEINLIDKYVTTLFFM